MAAGAIAKKILSEFGVQITAYTYSIGKICIDMGNFDKDIIYKNAVRMPDNKAAIQAEELIESMRTDGDSIGGVVECTIHNLPAGVGEPVFNKLEAVLSKAIMSIGAARSIEFGTGYTLSTMRGSEANDNYMVTRVW